MSTLSLIQKEICVKFFHTPLNHTASNAEKILYISNPERRKNCPPDAYDYSSSVVDMSIGYKCINQKDIARLVVDMLRSSIQQTVSTINSHDLIRQFQNQDQDPSSSTLLSPMDKNYINSNYQFECGSFGNRPPPSARRFGDNSAQWTQLSPDNWNYYSEKLWPLGIVMYGIEKRLRDSPSVNILKNAMTSIELSTCIVFQKTHRGDAVLVPKNLLWFGSDGDEAPQLGFREGNQTVKLETMVHGAPGHAAHAVVNLIRALGIPMMSNRYDRDHYITINWKNVEKGKEHYLERTPKEAWLQGIPYEFDSITHAPANYMCGACQLGAQTVQPIQDNLWQKTMSMGHKTTLSNWDIRTINLLYSKECQKKFLSHD